MNHDPDLVDIDTLATTRGALHQLAEHVLAAARYQSDGRIGLGVIPGGIATPPYGPMATSLAVIGNELIVSDASGVRRHAISTLADAAAAAGAQLGGPATVYHLSTALEPDTPLSIDLQTAAQLSAWLNLGDAALRQFTEAHADLDPSPIVLWPEHFDLGIAMDGCNYGVSPGDAGRPEPYVYVGPHLAEQHPASNPFWNEPYGAAVSWREIADVGAAVTFFEHGLANLS